MQLLKNGEAKNNKKLLELGKEVTQTVIDRYADSFFGYVKVEDIKDETLILIGKKLYSNSEAFMDYLRNVYDEHNFNWGESKVNSYDLIQSIVEYEIINSGEYYFDNNSELFLLVTDVSKVEKEEDLTYRINEIKIDSPLVIMLNKDEGDFIMIMTSYGNVSYILEHDIECLKDESIKDRYLRNDDEDYVLLVDNIYSLISKYKRLNAYKNWSYKEIACQLWNYMKYTVDFENIELYFIDENSINYNKLINSIAESLTIKEDKTIVDKIKKELYLFSIQEISYIDDLYLDMKKIIDKSIINNFKNEFILTIANIWKPVVNTDKFKADIQSRINKLLDIDSLDLPCVLPKELELNIINNYIKDILVEAIRNENEYSIFNEGLEYLWNKAKEYIGIFSSQGRLKNLTEEELHGLSMNALDYRDTEDIPTISVRYLRHYLMDVLLPRNNTDNKLDLIALYYLMLEDINKIEPYINDILNNGFTFEKLEYKVKKLQVYEIDIKKYASEEFKNIFKSYIFNDK